MPITKRPSERKIEDFINNAPDGTAARNQELQITRTGKPGRPVKAEKTVQITISLSARLLVEVDQAADALSISRAAFMRQAFTKALQ